MEEQDVIYKTALVSRFMVILIQYVSNIIIPDHEAAAYGFPKSEDYNLLDQIIAHLFGGFLRWDAHHFMHIARYGYTYEHTLAFFPLYPYLVRFIAVSISNFIPFMNLDSLTLLVFTGVNVLFFILSALCLYKLSLFVLSRDLAYRATILFCFNPASVFFSAPYTESLFCYLTFKSMLNCILLYKKYCDIQTRFEFRDVVFIIPICLSTLTRSNGVLNIGFLVYVLICLYLEKATLEKQIYNQVLFAAKFLLVAVVMVLICLLPFGLYQIYSFHMFCKDFKTDLPLLVLKHSDIETFVLPGTFSKENQSWCFNTVPLAYSYIQSHYWKVGFLQYYELKQIPNFLLALPIVYIILGGAFKYFGQFPKQFSKLFNFKLFQKSAYSKTNFNPTMIVFVIHSTVLTVFCVLNIHIQVTTRMLCSASPILYWFSASYVSDLTAKKILRKLIYERGFSKENFVLVYFLCYFLVGTVMFCNFLPWT